MGSLLPWDTISTQKPLAAERSYLLKLLHEGETLAWPALWRHSKNRETNPEVVRSSIFGACLNLEVLELQLQGSLGNSSCISQLTACYSNSCTFPDQSHQAFIPSWLTWCRGTCSVSCLEHWRSCSALLGLRCSTRGGRLPYTLQWLLWEFPLIPTMHQEETGHAAVEMCPRALPQAKVNLQTGPNGALFMSAARYPSLVYRIAYL